MAKKPKVFNAITPGDPLAFEDKRIDTLVGLYHGSKNRLRKIATETPTPAELWRANALLKQVDGEIAFLNEKAVEFSGKAASDSYRAGWRVTDKAAKAQGVTEAANWGALINTRAVKIVADQMAQDLITANQSMKGTFTRYIRATQQKIISENEINRMIGEGLISGATRRETSTAFYKQLTAQMKDDKFITIKGRNYDPEHYAELVARTRTREAATEGMINGALQCGMDLMQVSVHSHPRLDPCSPHQGRVYSISGTHPDFPKLVERPPYHCNCRHVISATNEATLRRRGQYDALVELSGNQPKDPTNRKSLEAWVKDDKPKMFADSREYYEYLNKKKEGGVAEAVATKTARRFKPAKTKAEAEEWARLNLVDEPFKEEKYVDRVTRKVVEIKKVSNVSFRGVDLEMANTINEELSRSIDAGVPRFRTVVCRNAKAEWGARVSNFGELEINTKYTKTLKFFRENEQSMAEHSKKIDDVITQLSIVKDSLSSKQKRLLSLAVETKRYKRPTASESIKGFLSHESGHHIFRKGTALYKGDMDKWDEMVRESLKELVLPKHKYNISALPEFYSVGDQPEEFFAEAFALYRAGGVADLPPKTRKLFEEYIR